MGDFSNRQKAKEEAKQSEKLSRETLGKYFYDLAKGHIYRYGGGWRSSVDFRFCIRFCVATSSAWYRFYHHIDLCRL